MGNKVKKIFMRKRVPRLPDAYQEVDYIQCSGTQYIDSGYIPNYNTEISCKFMHTEHVIDTPVFGTRNSSSQREYVLWSHPTEYASNTVGTKFNSTEKQNITSYPQGTDITFHYDRTGWQYGDYSGTWSPSSGSPSYNLIVMGLQNAGSVDSRRFAGRLYYFQIGESGVLVRDFVPCYRKSDSVIGMYDLVNNQFYTNSGSGSFTKGTDSSTLELKEFQVWPDDEEDIYYSDKNRNEYQSLVNSVGSVNFVDTGRRYRFGSSCCYIGDRIAINVSGTSWNKVNLDTLTVISTKTLGNSIGGRFWYFGENRILTRRGILDFDGNFITTFSYTFNTIVPGLPGVVWANASFDIYKGIVDGDNITFTKVGTGSSDQSVGGMFYGRLGDYLINYNDNSGSGYSSYINPSTNAISNFTGGSSSRQDLAVSGADGKLYRWACRDNGWGRFQKIGTTGEGFVGSTLSTSWTMYGRRIGKFLGNIVSGGMSSYNGTGTGYGSNNYFINTSGTLTLAQSNALAYDSNIYTHLGFIDENGWIYPHTDGGGSGVILKTDKTFTDFNWKNPYLWR